MFSSRTGDPATSPSSGSRPRTSPSSGPGSFTSTCPSTDPSGPGPTAPGSTRTPGAVSGLLAREGTFEEPALTEIFVVNDYAMSWLSAMAVMATLQRRAVEGGSYEHLPRPALDLVAPNGPVRQELRPERRQHDRRARLPATRALPHRHSLRHLPRSDRPSCNDRNTRSLSSSTRATGIEPTALGCKSSLIAPGHHNDPFPRAMVYCAILAGSRNGAV